MNDERFIPGTSRITEIESFHRYLAAAEPCRNKKVLDAASGEGYGSAILARSARETVGLDICAEAVAEAAEKYASPNLRFVCGDVCAMPFSDGEFDCAVSFETIEHLDKPERLLAELRRVVKPTGFVILSSPNKTVFDRRNHNEHGENVYHKHELERDELVEMMKRFFPQVAVHAQDSFFNSQIGGDAAMRYFVRKGGAMIGQEALTGAQYSIVVGGAGTLPTLSPSSCIDADFDEKFGYQPDSESVVNQFGLRGEYETARAELAAERGNNEKLQSECENARAELSAERKNNEKLQDEYKSVRTELATERKNNERLQSECEKVCAELATERKNNEKLQSECENVRTELALTSEKLTASENNAAHLASELKKLRSDDEAMIADLKRRLIEECAKSESIWKEYEKIRKSWAFRIFGQHGFAWAQRMLLGLGNFTCRCGKGVLYLLRVRQSTRIDLKNVIYSRFGFCLKTWHGYNDWLLVHRNTAAGKLRPGAGLEIPDDLPLTSIIIPVYDNFDYTLNCLHAIYGIKSRAPFEVIVVDDCSTKNYASLLCREYPQVRVVRNEKNSGFLLTANRGASEAKGEYIVFLNNDTEVLPGWLDELAVALHDHPKAGMIGSQLIHMRTGTLQESGNLICKDGGMLPLGRGCDPDHPEFSYFREVDFSSAASIILRKRVFDEMKGFDTSYAPAYFEDPDLGLRLQRAGYHNYVMPLSRVMHMEMASYGDALGSRCERNRNFFIGRWKEYLAKHAAYDTPQEFSSCRKFSRERLLYIDAEMPMADRGSGGMDAIFFMNYFIKRGFEVVFHGEYTPGGSPKYTEILLRMGVECVYLPHRKIWEYLESNGWTFSWLFISRIYQAQCFDRLLKKHCPQARYIFDTVDLHFVREQLEAELHDDPRMRKQAARTKQFELAVARSADATIVISRDEKKLLETEYGLTNVWHIPQARAIAGRREGAVRKGAVFIGSAHPPNMDGLRYFHDEILPLLPKDFRLTIVGEALRDVMKEMPEYQHLLKCPQFRFVGFVRDLGDVLDTALMTVAPLRYGAGTKGKVASSMSYGVPCVSSDFGVEGTGMAHGKNILLARTPEEFAGSIRALGEDPQLWQKISDGGLEFLRSEYDPAAVEAEMDKLFADLRSSVRKDGGWAGAPVIPKQEELPSLD